MLYYENQLNLGNIYKECSKMFKEQRLQFLSFAKFFINEITSLINILNIFLAG